MSILEYAGLPGILGDRLFSVLDANGDGYIDMKEFIYVMFLIYYSSFEAKVKLIFDIYDFDRDGRVSKEDIRIILGFVPLLQREADA